MPSHLEETLQRDIDQIRDRVLRMGDLAEEALRTTLEALRQNKRHLAYSVILRDRYIDELEKELDRLCQTFLVRQQPVGAHLRFVYAVIKINNELERIGDYAESIARHFLALSGMETEPPYDKLVGIGNLAIPMFRNALQAFREEDPELAKATMEQEGQVDDMRYEIHKELIALRDKRKIPSSALLPLMTIASRFERVADQACNICEEVLFMCTGVDVKHEGKGTFRILFVDEGDSCRGQMAEGIGRSLKLERFQFSSAGIAPRPVDERTVTFMAEKGIDISKQSSKFLHQILNLGSYAVIVSLCKEAEDALPPPPTKTVRLRWHIEDPSRLKGTEAEIRAAYEKTYQFLETHIRDLVEAVLGDGTKEEEVANA